MERQTKSRSPQGRTLDVTYAREEPRNLAHRHGLAQPERANALCRALSCWIAFLRVIYGGGGRRQAVLESCLCGAITAGAFPLLEYFNLPSSLAAAVGACIGTLGVKKVAALADRFTDFKLPKRQE
jgi:lambda family phage holin